MSGGGWARRNFTAFMAVGAGLDGLLANVANGRAKEGMEDKNKAIEGTYIYFRAI